MNVIYTLNYAVFAAFFTLFVIEVGIAASFLISYRDKDRLKRYLMPVWEITGTFAVFYLVNFEASFPTAIKIIGSAYLVPLLIAAMFFIFRNAFIAYSEYISNVRSERTFLRIYSVATIITAFVVVAVLGSGVSGIGINVQAMSANIYAMLFNPFALLLFVSVALIGIFVISVFFGLGRRKRLVYTSAPIAILLIFAALYLYDRYALVNAAAYWPILAFTIALLAVVMYLDAKAKKASRYAVVAWLFWAIMYFGMIMYPYWFGGTVNSQSYLVNAITGRYTVAITITGGVFLVGALTYFIYIAYLKRPNGAVGY